jgi:predicted site-specific integrase-resolvase
MKHLKIFENSEEDIDLRGWEFSRLLENCIQKNCKVIPYEGTEVDKPGIVEDIINALESKGWKLKK